MIYFDTTKVKCDKFDSLDFWSDIKFGSLDFESDINHVI